MIKLRFRTCISKPVWALLGALCFVLQSSAQEEAKPQPEVVVQKAYLEKVNCSPTWPTSALRKEQFGTVTLAFKVSAESVLVDSKVIGSSGSPALDEAALLGLRECKFHAATVDGKAVESWFAMKYVWQLY